MGTENRRSKPSSNGLGAAQGQRVAPLGLQNDDGDLAAPILNAIESMDIAMARIDTDYRVVAFNRKAREIYGDIPLGDFCYHMAAGLHEVCGNCPAKQVFDGQATGRSEHKVTTAAGEEIYIDHIATPVKDADGNITGALLLIIDLTRYKRQEEELLSHRRHLETLVQERSEALEEREKALRESEERLDLALAGANEGIWDWYLDNNTLHFDARYYTMAGYAPDAFPAVFEEWQKRVHPDDIQKTKAAIEHYLSGDLEAFDVEFRFLRKDGSYMWIQGRGKIVARNEQGDPIRFTGTHADITQRKQIEESLRITQFSFDRAAVGIYRIASDARILEVNDKAARIIGYTQAELASMSIFDIDPNVTPANWGGIWQQLLVTGLDSFETHHRTKDGKIMPVQITSNLLEYDGRQYSICFVQDITERKRTEESLRLTQFSFDHANIGIYRIAPDGQIINVNQKAAQMLGYAKQELEALSVADIDTRLTCESWGSNWQGLIAQGMRVFEREHIRKDGSAIPVEIYSNFLQYEGREYAIAFVQDITERKRSEEELRSLRNYLSNIIDSMPSVLVAVNRDGRVTQWNNRAEKTTGLRWEEVRSRPLVEVFPHLAGKTEQIETAIRECRVIGSPRESRRLGQDVRYENVTIFPLVANGVEGAVIRVDDVTERVRLEEMMIQSEKMLSVGGLAAGMAHEINNPLAGMIQTATVMQNRLTKADLPANRQVADNAGTTMEAVGTFIQDRGILRMLETIRQSGLRAADIVTNMLSFARKSDKAVSSQDIGLLMDQSLALLKTDYDMKKHYDFKQTRLIREYEKDVPPVPCEASKIQQVFMNILKNGAEAMAAADASAMPTFVLRVQDDGRWVRVEIEDNGPGMDTATRRRIFEPFFTTKPVGQGTGLGLSVSYFIITEDHGGEMGAYAADGGGTRFVIRLPKQDHSGL